MSSFKNKLLETSQWLYVQWEACAPKKLYFYHIYFWEILWTTGGNSCQLLSRFCTIYSFKWKSVHTFWKDILFINSCFSEGKVIPEICIIQGEQVCIRSFFVLLLSCSLPEREASLYRWSIIAARAHSHPLKTSFYSHACLRVWERTDRHSASLRWDDSPNSWITSPPRAWVFVSKLCLKNNRHTCQTLLC